MLTGGIYVGFTWITPEDGNRPMQSLEVANVVCAPAVMAYEAPIKRARPKLDADAVLTLTYQISASIMAA
jgi:hypothetical protein